MGQGEFNAALDIVGPCPCPWCWEDGCSSLQGIHQQRGPGGAGELLAEALRLSSGGEAENLRKEVRWPWSA